MQRPTAPRESNAHDEREARFRVEAEPMLRRVDVTESRMMGLPCLRVAGAFFASFDRRTGALLVKLPEATVDELVARGQAEAFAPAGRRFREWAAIPTAALDAWAGLLAQAHEHVASTRLSNPGVARPGPTE